MCDRAYVFVSIWFERKKTIFTKLTNENSKKKYTMESNANSAPSLHLKINKWTTHIHTLTFIDFACTFVYICQRSICQSFRMYRYSDCSLSFALMWTTNNTPQPFAQKVQTMNTNNQSISHFVVNRCSVFLKTVARSIQCVNFSSIDSGKSHWNQTKLALSFTQLAIFDKFDVECVIFGHSNRQIYTNLRSKTKIGWIHIVGSIDRKWSAKVRTTFFLVMFVYITRFVFNVWRRLLV